MLACQLVLFHACAQMVPPAAIPHTPANAVCTFNVGETFHRAKYPIFAVKVRCGATHVLTCAVDARRAAAGDVIVNRGVHRVVV